MKKILSIVLIALITLTAGFSGSALSAAKVVKPIKTATPARPKGQTDVVNLVTPKLDVVRVGFIGLGMRGPGAVERWTHIPGVKIVALCDLLPERVAGSQKIL